MIKSKKQIREDFRNGVFKRDKNTCQICGYVYERDQSDYITTIHDKLDAHHITDRNNMPYGGYVLENGITVCKDTCHRMVEIHAKDNCVDGYCPSVLYEMIGSSWEEAVRASIELLGKGLIPGEHLDWHPLAKYGKVTYGTDEIGPVVTVHFRDVKTLDDFLMSI